MDLIVPWLNHFVSIYDSGRIFLLLTITLLALGPSAIHYGPVQATVCLAADLDHLHLRL